MAEDVSEAVCVELAEDSELLPDSDDPETTWPEFGGNSKLMLESDVSAPACPESAEDCELLPDSDVPVADIPVLSEDSELMPDSDVSAPACPEFADDPELMPDSDDPAPVTDVVSALKSEDPLPSSVPVAIVEKLSEAPSSEDDLVFDSIFVLDMTLLVESFGDEEPTSEDDPLEIKPVDMASCKLLGLEVDVGPPSLDVLPSDTPAVAGLPPIVSSPEEVPIVVEDDV